MNIKGFYLYYIDHSCFKCGEDHKEIIGWYKGEPNREVLLKLAQKLAYRHLIDIAEEDLKNSDKITVTDYEIIINTPMDRIRYKTETFELKEID